MFHSSLSGTCTLTCSNMKALMQARVKKKQAREKQIILSWKNCMSGKGERVATFLENSFSTNKGVRQNLQSQKTMCY